MIVFCIFIKITYNDDNRTTAGTSNQTLGKHRKQNNPLFSGTKSGI
jgi:hypothetical protein